jgi:hypothetical protein
LLSRPVWLPRRLRAGLTRLVAAVRIVQGRIGATQGALLAHDLPAEILRGMDLTHKTLIAQRLLRRYRQRHRGEANASRAGPYRKTA